jgi:hypothetical protein
MPVLTTQQQLQETRHVEGVEFQCCQCKAVKPVQTSGGTGYGYNKQNEPVCYDCCGENDRAEMIATGKAVLYLTCEPASKMRRANGLPFTPETAREGSGRKTAGEVTNWPGTLRLKCHTQAGRHNIAGTRYDCWFTGPDGYEWHGVTYGEDNQLCRCKRTKNKVR